MKSWSAFHGMILVLCIAAITACGCSVGPFVIRGTRTKYNKAVQVTAREEMLLNIVRARYNDPPEFLAVSGITTQFEVGSFFGFGQDGGITDGNLAGNLAASDRPTISLTPLQDEQFTRRFLSPIRLETIYLFSRNGRRLDRMLRIIVERVNGLSNSPDDLDPEGKPEAFLWLAQTLGELARQQQVEISYEERIEPVSPLLDRAAVKGADVIAALEKGYQFRPADRDQALLTGKRRELVFRFAQKAVGRPEVVEITNLLGLLPGQLVYPIKPATEGQLRPAPPLREELVVSTRSVEEILHFLAHGVEVPSKHAEKGWVAQVEQAGSCPMAIGDLLRIRSSKVRPCHAYIAVCYHGHWFYIDEADTVSRETFELLLELYYLEIRGGGAVGSPLLTLPVGR